jgi:hypothetical protein
MSKTKTHLTAYRERVLREAASRFGSMTPSGSPRSGQEASNWWRAVDWLQKSGLVTRSQNRATATQSGRDLLSDGARHE